MTYINADCSLQLIVICNKTHNLIECLLIEHLSHFATQGLYFAFKPTEVQIFICIEWGIVWQLVNRKLPLAWARIFLFVFVLLLGYTESCLALMHSKINWFESSVNPTRKIPLGLLQCYLLLERFSKCHPSEIRYCFEVAIIRNQTKHHALLFAASLKERIVAYRKDSMNQKRPSRKSVIRQVRLARYNQSSSKA